MTFVLEKCSSKCNAMVFNTTAKGWHIYSLFLCLERDSVYDVCAHSGHQSCSAHLSGCCDQTPYKSNLRKGELTLLTVSRTQCIRTGEEQQQD